MKKKNYISKGFKIMKIYQGRIKEGANGAFAPGGTARECVPGVQKQVKTFFFFAILHF